MSGHAVLQPDIAGDVEGYWKRKAAALMKLSPSNMLWVFHNFGGKGGTGVSVEAAGTGSAVPDAGLPANLLVTTPGLNGNLVNIFADSSRSSTRPKMFKGTASAKWAVFAEFALLDPIAGSSVTAVGFQDNGTTGFVYMGESAAVSATNFMVRSVGAGVNIDSGRAKDAAFHIHQIWRDGTNGFYQIDNFARIQGDIRTSVDCSLALTVQDGAANQHRMKIAWWAAGAAKT